jgi:hypothetical protein
MKLNGGKVWANEEQWLHYMRSWVERRKKEEVRPEHPEQMVVTDAGDTTRSEAAPGLHDDET